MFCTNCGNQIDDAARFCPSCGQSVAKIEATAPRIQARLSRPMNDKKIAGVCAGFARYFDTDVTLMRVIWIVTALFTGVGFIAYLVGWIAMPADYEPWHQSVA